MEFLDLVLPSAAENIALDEALLEDSEAAAVPREVLRLWESPQEAIVIGRSSRVEEEVKLSFCRARGIPVLRRCSGGAAVVIGQGCLMYSVVLNYSLRPALRSIENAHGFVLGRLVDAIRNFTPGVTRAGTSDLVNGNCKFSGNSLRCKRSNLLYHGTVLYDFPIDLISTCLKTPPRQPEYRERRGHQAFVTNLSAPADGLRGAIASVWEIDKNTTDWPTQLTQQLMSDRYGSHDWHFLR